MNIEERKAALQSRVRHFEAIGFTYISKELRQRARTAVRLSMGDYIADDDTRRKVLGWLFVGNTCSLSTAALHDAQLAAVKQWLNVLPAEDGTWTISEAAAGELRQLAEWLGQGQPQKIGPVVQAAIALGGEVAGLEKRKLYYEFDE